ncbi:NAD(P)/FAD-dependent oxidoreductase [Undibacterium sp. Tian12W]|uniref:NAD(P)/FAD-dependent oxidoreductase n=1 Tax=Undibacterium sp. Tian12W TaxID=3413054 RepID=UPI003BF317EC
MTTITKGMMFDVIIIGGSYAGLSAAMQLARARRQVLVIDGGQRRNRFVEYSHGFLGQDGKKASVIASEGKAQLMAYKTVTWVEGQATSAARQEDGFIVTVEGQGNYQARRLILATGVTDDLPAIEGLAERWGRSIFHCPYCHGYEIDNGRIGVLATSPLSYHHAMMLPDWGQVTLFTNQCFEPDAEQLVALQKRGVTIEAAPVSKISGLATVELQDGRQHEMDGLFTMGTIRINSPFAAQLACEMTEGPMGTVIRTNEIKATSVPGVFACGDAARMAGNVAMAVADGAMAGVAAHQSMIFEAKAA